MRISAICIALAVTLSPATHPRVMGMRVDTDGRLWLRLPSAGRSVVSHVYHQDGRHAGSVRLPSGVEPLDISSSHLVGVERDDLGVQTVVVYSSADRLIPFED
jgi:sugar lactone lactonase YvrE